MKKLTVSTALLTSAAFLFGLMAQPIEANNKNEWSFEAMDTNKDTKISKDEFKAPHIRHIEAKFDLWDKDKDGNLSSEELKKGRKKVRKRHKKKKVKMMEKKEEEMEKSEMMENDVRADEAEIEEKKLAIEGDGQDDPEDAISNEYNEGQGE